MSNEESTSAPSGGAEEWDWVQGHLRVIREEAGKVIVGQDEVIEQMLVALLCGGHCLIVGVPGLAKTLLVSTFGKILGLDFRRIQFTPDLMPTDILGSEILQTGEGGERRFEFTEGPIFANLILADEINRTPPKTQAALLEAMQEKQVTVAGKERKLEEPFLVFATQNPIEHEGTYPLPEAQLDRFFFEIKIGYPDIKEEAEVLRRTIGHESPSVESVTDAAGVARLQRAAIEVPISENVLEELLQLVHRSRPDSDLASDEITRYVAFGAGPRASQCLARAARALAMVRGQSSATMEEVRAVALPVLRHRIVPNYNATGEGVTVEDIVGKLLG